MRARMALVLSQQQCELREVVLRNKPAEMLAASPKATVPVLIDTDGVVHDESFDIMLWAFARNDPHEILSPQLSDRGQIQLLIASIEGPFKKHLDRYKYAPRDNKENNADGIDPVAHRDAAMDILSEFETRLAQHTFLFGEKLSLADIATAPFVRQFRNTDADWFAAQPYPRLQQWLTHILDGAVFQACMEKYAPWQSGEAGITFPDISPANR